MVVAHRRQNRAVRRGHRIPQGRHLDAGHPDEGCRRFAGRQNGDDPLEEPPFDLRSKRLTRWPEGFAPGLRSCGAASATATRVTSCAAPAFWTGRPSRSSEPRLQRSAANASSLSASGGHLAQDGQEAPHPAGHPAAEPKPPQSRWRTIPERQEWRISSLLSQAHSIPKSVKRRLIFLKPFPDRRFARRETKLQAASPFDVAFCSNRSSHWLLLPALFLLCSSRA